MDRRTAEWLLEKDIFEVVMTATRGPDSQTEEDLKLKRWLTAPLRWAIGFDYGSVGPPAASPNLPLHSGVPPIRTTAAERYHFIEHAWGALHALYRVGYELSRIPLWVYLAADITQERYGHELLDRILETMEKQDLLHFGDLYVALENTPFHRIDL